MVAQYTTSWFHSFLTNSASSAAEIVPILLDLTGSQSVVDLGCGLGVWLREFARQGLTDIVGLDGDYVERDALLISRECFVPHDLVRPLKLDRSFDLATCLEVAEHLPESSAEGLVKSLVSLAPIVFFSAAIPAQGGTNHINEQWPEYWAQLFASHDYLLVDAVRPRIWNNPAIDFWYAQNAVLYVRRDVLAKKELLRREWAQQRPLSLVHPRLFLRTQQMLESTLDFRLRRLAQRINQVARSWLRAD